MMETIYVAKVFTDAGKLYKDLDLDEYKKVYSTFDIQIPDFDTLEKLLLHLNHFTCYLLCSKVNDNQKYVLCHHIITISKSINSSNLEMKQCFYNKLFFFTDSFIYNDDTDADLIKWLYRIYINLLVKETDLNLYTSLLQLCTNFFVEESEDLVIDFIKYSMESDRVVQSMIKQYVTNRTSLVWDDTEYAMSNFLYHIALEYIKNLSLFQTSIQLEFSKKQLGIVFLLLSSDDEEVWFLTMYYLSVITFSLKEYAFCKDLFTNYNIDKIFQYINNIDVPTQETMSYLFLQSLNNVMVNCVEMINKELINSVFNHFTKKNYKKRQSILYELLHFITISFYHIQVDKEFAHQVIDTVKDIYNCINDENTTNMLLDSIITLVQKGYLCDDKEFFRLVYNDGYKYVHNSIVCFRYSILIHNWLTKSFKNGWNLNKIALKNIDIVDNCIKPDSVSMYVKNVLISISLFDKCRLKIQNNYTKYTYDELDLFNFFTNNK